MDNSTRRNLRKVTWPFAQVSNEDPNRDHISPVGAQTQLVVSENVPFSDVTGVRQ